MPSYRKITFTIVGLTLAIALLYYVIHQVDTDTLISNLQQMDKLWLLPIFAIYCISIFLRSLRWRLFYPKDSRTSVWISYNALVLGNASNLIIPARGGDIVRVVILGRLSGLSNSVSLATILTERVFDLVMLCVLTGIAALLVPLPESIQTGALIIAAVSVCAVIGFFITVAFYYYYRDWLDTNIIRRCPKFLHHRLHELLVGLSDGLRLMLKTRSGFLFIGYTILIWTTELGILSMLATSLSFSLGILHSVAVFLCTAIGTLIPLTTAQIGVFEFIVVSTLENLGYDPAKALALGMLWHAIILVYPIILGLFSWPFMRHAIGAGLLTRNQPPS